MSISLSQAEPSTFYHKQVISQCNVISHSLEWSPEDSWGSYCHQPAK